MSTIKIRRGNNASLPSGGTVAGEPRFSTDTGQFYIDDGTNNIEITPNTTNVAAAGALMDSECTSLADVKALDQSVVSGASPTFSTANMTDATNKRFMTDAQETVLDNTSGTNTGDESAATTSAAGIVELATGAETVTGTDTGRAVTPDGLTDRLASPGDIGGTAAGDVNYVTGIGTVSALGNLGATEAIDWS
ncbi:MAG: hypothetical protein KDH96_09485, partial [Candidatus Riesia sp.]|nr:hypothetical protein [Candidatus Riesia sp.]